VLLFFAIRKVYIIFGLIWLKSFKSAKKICARHYMQTLKTTKSFSIFIYCCLIAQLKQQSTEFVSMVDINSCLMAEKPE